MEIGFITLVKANGIKGGIFTKLLFILIALFFSLYVLSEGVENNSLQEKVVAVIVMALLISLIMVGLSYARF